MQIEGLALHWAPAEGIFPSQLAWVLTPFPNRNTLSDESVNQGLVCAYTHSSAQTQKILTSGVALTRKNCVFYAKKEQATQIWKCGAFTVRKKQWPHTSKCVSPFRFLHPPEKVCRALAVGLSILDFPRPLPPPFPIPFQWRDAGAYTYCWWRNQKGLFPSFWSQRDRDQDKF